MNNQPEKKSISDAVLNKIKSGQVKMRPKMYFILRAILVMLAVIGVALFTLFLISFINFNLRASGVLFLPDFGFRGIGLFFKSLPWLLILVALLLIIVLEVLVKRFSFTYRRPILYSVLAIIIIVFLGSFIIGKTQLHPGLFWRAQEGKLPVAGPFYREYGLPKLKDVHPGVVSEITDDGFRIETPQGDILTIIITPQTRFKLKTEIEENDEVVVLGERDNGIVEAFGIRKIDSDFHFLRHFRDKPRLPKR